MDPVSYQPVSTSPPTDPLSMFKLIVVWMIVGVPALWGVSKTVQTSLKLFQTPAAVVAPATQPAAASQPTTMP